MGSLTFDISHVTVVRNGGICRAGAAQSQNPVLLNVLLYSRLFVQKLCSGFGDESRGAGSF